MPKMPQANELLEILEQYVGVPPFSHEGWLIVGEAQRDQGWKLHVSATVLSAPEVLTRVAPILREADVPYKITATLGHLSELNDGAGGLAQVGKFITIYPEDDRQAVDLAVALDRETYGLSGPRVPSDCPLRPGGLVHYRYGGFRGLEVVDSLGHVSPAIREPNGRLVADQREPRFQSPPWVVDPFEAAGVVEHPSRPTSPLFAGYLMLTVLHQSAKGGVYWALDPSVSPPRECVIKEARRHTVTGMDGCDIRDRLRHQHHLLQLLELEPGFPTPYNLFELEENLYLVMEPIEGESLQSLVVSRQNDGAHLTAAEIAALGAQLAETVGQLHGHGWVCRDVTPTNVLVSEENRVVLIDLELAQKPGDRSSFGWGTPGYTSPQQAQRRPPAIADDVYALGATLYFAATGADPAFVPYEGDHRRRALRLLNPNLPSALIDCIGDCMSFEPSDRPATMADAARRLSASVRHVTPTGSNPRRSQARDGHGGFKRDREQRYLDFAKAAGERLLTTCHHSEEGISWLTTAATTSEQPGLNATYLARRARMLPFLHTGTAGTLLFLTYLAEATGDERYLSAARGAGQWLWHHCAERTDMLPSLHFGRAGVAAALCRLAEITGESTYVEQAATLAGQCDPGLTESPDITHGWAGIGMLNLWLATVSSSDQAMVRARDVAEMLIARAERFEDGVAWRQPPGPYPGMSDEILTGFAHGAAGIGYFFLELWQATKDARYFGVASEVARWLASVAEPALADQAGLNWKIAWGNPKNQERWYYWCHGAAGIALFYLRAWELTGDPEYRRVAVAAVTTIARAGRRGGGALCHGLPGNGAMLLRAYQVLEDEEWLESAHACADLLSLYAKQDEYGTVWPSEHPRVSTPDLMVGYAGTGLFFLRASQPGIRPNPVSLPII